MTKRRLRSQEWFDNPDNPGMTALYIERYLNYSYAREELQGGAPIIGIAQTGSDLAPCNKIHMFLSERVKAGIRSAGGVPLEFPIHPIQETGKRPTAALDRNLAYLSLVEVLNGYPIDGVVLTTGCDKTTPAQLMGAATVDLPAIVLSGGPMLDGWWKGELAGSGTVVWESRRLLSAGEIDYDEFLNRVCSSAPSLGHCNTMGTASTMNALAEALGMSLTGCAAIPAPYAERSAMAYATGRRAVEIVHEDLRPSQIMTREAFENVIRVNTAIGGSTNAPPHMVAVARHAGVELTTKDWETVGFDLPLLVNMQPAGHYLGESFQRAGGVPAVMGEMLAEGLLHGAALTISGKTIAENLSGRHSEDARVIRSVADPMRHDAGFLVLSGNLFDNALMKTSVISPDFRQRFLSEPGQEGVLEARAVVFEGPEDYHDRLNEPGLIEDDRTIMFIRHVGPIGYPGAAEVVN
ncbi:MAG: IlvD/Edd family dehydratase, partial [Pseudomonadota bacterium]